MPAGPEPLGLVYFAAVKFAGYTAAARFLTSQLPENRPNSFVVGGVRTAIGFVAGIAAVFVVTQIGVGREGPIFFSLLVPVRVAEWLVLLAIFYRKPDWSWARSLKYAALGTAWSFLLDLPAILAVFALPGGSWIC